MATEIKLKKGLDIRLQGVASQIKREVALGGLFAVSPDDFYGLKPKVVVHEGDEIKAGEPLFVSKQQEELKVVSPVSGKVVHIVRGDRRKVLCIELEQDPNAEPKHFGTRRPAEMSGAEVKAHLLESGLFAFIKMRPYDVVANPEDKPKAIFISAFSKMPLAADFSFVVKHQGKDFLTGIEALSRMAKVYVGIRPDQIGEVFTQTEYAEVNVFNGPNPSGNVGVQINHVLPINKGETVWTIGAEEVIFIGRLFNAGTVELKRTIAIAGSEVLEPAYADVMIGMHMGQLLKGWLKNNEHIRIINGNPLVGRPSWEEDYLSARVTEICVIPEGDDVNEVLGWIKPRLKQFSTSRSYFSWLQGKKNYDLDARVKGGTRHMIMSGEYDKVFPMDIYAGYLVKAIIAGDIDRMEQLGIYEVAPEDFAVAEFVDSSKLELQSIVREGLDLLRKEMA